MKQPAAKPAPSRAVWWRSPSLVIIGASTAYALVVTYPVVFNLGSMIYGYPGDATGTVATYEFWAQALRQHQSIFENNLWGAPYGAGWQAVPFAVISLALASLSALLGGIGAYNLEVLASFPLTAWTTYLVARRFGCRPLAAAFAGLAFAFIPYHIEKAQGHAGQTHTELFSATLLFLMRWRQGGSRWNLAGAGTVAGVTLWIDYYFAFIDAFLVATFFAASFLRGKGGESWWPRLRTHVVAALILGLATAAFVPVTVLVAERGSLAGSLAAQTASFNQSLAEVRVYSSRPFEFLLPYHANPLVPKRVVDYETSRLHYSNFTEQSLFIGYTVMVLAALWVLVAWRRFETIVLLAIGAVGFLVSLPPGLNFNHYVVPTPSLLLNPVFPIFRVYARFGILVLLGAAILAGLGLSWAQERLRRRAALLLSSTASRRHTYCASCPHPPRTSGWRRSPPAFWSSTRSPRARRRRRRSRRTSTSYINRSTAIRSSTAPQRPARRTSCIPASSRTTVRASQGRFFRSASAMCSCIVTNTSRTAIRCPTTCPASPTCRR